MKFFPSHCLFIVISYFCLTTGHTNATTGFSMGEAYSINGKELLYRETHCQSNDKLKREVLYKNRDGESIAYKSLDYSNGFTVPSFRQTNFQTNEETEVVLNDDLVTLSFTDANREQTQKSIETTANDDLPMVIDAGFDAFIRLNWDNLVSGNTQQFQFPLATRTSLVELQVSASNCSFESENSQCFTLEMSNWFYRMLVNPIELGYDGKLKQLMRYRGLSNIEDKNGTGIDVDIRYYYGDLPLQACLLGPKSTDLQKHRVDHHG